VEDEPARPLTDSVINKNARSGSADRDPRTTSGHDNHGANEKVSRDWGRQPRTLHAMSSTYNLSMQDAG
jgi:hypothetical protein